ncbi:MAG: UDP-3-O-acyl-N-acetylglucosamine deacetylase, partial [Vampirovibrionales bacterium]|nr:UDP-3-O-acyl-N-acetylglucosamine deacetylase [Vampirovibrionales bacterium]
MRPGLIEASAVEASALPAQADISLSDIGLISGLPVTARLSSNLPGSGVRFLYARTEHDTPVEIPATLEAVVNADRGVTLADTSRRVTLSIVEHFLAACAMTHRLDVTVRVMGAPELPLLDGSAAPWLEPLRRLPESIKCPSRFDFSKPLVYRHSDQIEIIALPDTHFKITYAVDFDHPMLRQRWCQWDACQDSIEQLASARTFGLVRELPVLQAQGLAKGVSLNNTLGLNEDGGTTTPLRMADEPIFHKMLDLIGDLTLATG